MTKAEIEEEVRRLLGSGKYAPHAGPSYTALLQHFDGIPIDQKCPYCGELLTVDDAGTAWIINCPCGQSKNTIRGL